MTSIEWVWSKLARICVLCVVVTAMLMAPAVTVGADQGAPSPIPTEQTNQPIVVALPHAISVHDALAAAEHVGVAVRELQFDGNGVVGGLMSATAQR